MNGQALPNKILVGYWHNFINPAGYVKLREVSEKWDVINVAFAETAGDHCTVQFIPDQQTEGELKTDIAYLQSLGKKVVLSIGGQNAAVNIPNVTAKQKFVDSMIAIIDQYGFQGLDLDIETGVSLGGGDTDVNNPTTPMIVNLIAATRSICERYGAGFILSMAPEVAYVQGGITSYATNWGAYLPIIHGLRDKLTYVHVQHYNCGGNAALDGATYSQGTADFEVAMAEMLLQGFPLGGNASNLFPALREDQVVIGLPACPAGAPSGGYITSIEMKKALDCLIRGVSYGGRYQLANPAGYPAFRGVMAWSVNWDAHTNFEFSNEYRAYFAGIQPPVPMPPLTPTGLKAIPMSSSQISVSWNLSTGATAYDLEIDGSSSRVATSSYVHSSLVPKTTHTYRLRAQNSIGVSAWSSVVSATTPEAGGQYQQWQVGTNYKVGDIVIYSGKVYKCRQVNTALLGWEPANVPALWEEIVA